MLPQSQYSASDSPRVAAMMLLTSLLPLVVMTLDQFSEITNRLRVAELLVREARPPGADA